MGMTETAAPLRPGKRDPAVPDCGKWMPKAKAHCARAAGHAGGCRTRKALDTEAERKKERYGEDGEFRRRAIEASSAWQARTWAASEEFRRQRRAYGKARYRRLKAKAEAS